MDGPPYRCAFGDVQNIDVEVTICVSTRVKDIGWEAILVPIMVNNPDVDFHVKFMGNSREPG